MVPEFPGTWVNPICLVLALLMNWRRLCHTGYLWAKMRIPSLLRVS